MTRAVVDTSVLVSALIARRDTPPSQLVRAWARGRFQLLVSPTLLSEVAGVLARDKFAGYVTRDEVADFLELLRGSAVLLADPPAVVGATRDPRDDYLVALARSAGATLVSGDRDLLEAAVEDVPVLSAGAFLKRLA